MAKIEPSKDKREYKDFYNGTSAEKLVCDWLENAINDEKFLGQHRFKIESRECDIAMIIPNRGILIIEVKGYPAEIIDYMESNFKIFVKNEYENERFKNGEKHPAEQACDYVFTMIRDFSAYLKRNNIALPICKIGRMAAMPNLTDEEYVNLCLEYCYPTKLVITRNWFENKDIFYCRFIQALNIIFRAINSEANFDERYYDIAKGYILLSERQKKVNVNNNQSKQIVDNPINSRIINNENELDCLDQLNNSINREERIMKFSSFIKEESEILLENNIKISYSKLRIVKSGCKIESLMEYCDKERRNGTKQFLICINFTKYEREEILLEYEKRYSKKYKEDQVLFLFHMYFIDIPIHEINLDILMDNSNGIEIINGEKIQEIVKTKLDNINIQDYLPEDLVDKTLWKILCIADRDTRFNFDQYIVEHSPLRKNILITASAGTGKTYTMVDRVAFIVHMEIICGFFNQNISDLIFMMTFTNNSTNEMKVRLMQHFTQYFELTHKNVYMNLLEQIGCMKIKTIDSFTKYILSKFSHFLGLSNNFSLKSGKYEVENILQKHINKKINTDIIEDFHNINIYEIVNYIVSLRSFLINHKVQFDKIKHPFIIAPDTSKGTERMKNFIESVLSNTNNEYNEFNRRQNFIAMNELAIQLEKIQDKLKNSTNLDIDEVDYEKYLFVDEFQDTDNKQIQLIRFFADYFKLSLFIVGDEKQCIYGFRGAERTSFSELIREQPELKTRRWISYSLRKNYRTDKPLIDKMNEVFKKMPQNLFPYNDKDKLIAQNGISSSDIDCYKQYNYSEDKLIELLNTCIMRMKELNESGDIAILTRSNYEVDKVRNLLKGKMEYEIEFDNGGLFYSTDAVIDFYKLVDFLTNTEDNSKRYSILKTPYSDFRIKESRVKLYNNCKLMDVECFEEIRSGDKHISLQKYYDISYENDNENPNIRNSPILKILRMIVNEIKPWDHYVPEEYQNSKFLNNIDHIDHQLKLTEARKEYRKNLFQLFQKLIDDNKTDYLTLNKIHKFLAISIFTRQECDIDSSKDSLNKKKIRILCTTVHKSKGLQYHTVIMPFTTNDITKSKGLTQFIYKENKNELYIQIEKIESKKVTIYKSQNFNYENKKKNENIQSEELRILYVALTRAKKYFYYMVDKDKQNKNNNCTKKYWADYLSEKEFN